VGCASDAYAASELVADDYGRALDTTESAHAGEDGDGIDFESE
jgi:hypothetical protein